MSNYGRGRHFEYRIRDDLIERGYFVMRSAGSKTGVDLAGFHEERTLFVQAKGDGQLPPAEWNALMDLADRFGAVPVLAMRLKRKLVYRLLLQRKDGSGRRQPFEPFEP